MNIQMLALVTTVLAGMAHLLRNPVDRDGTGAQQLTGVGMTALARPAITNPQP